MTKYEYELFDPPFYPLCQYQMEYSSTFENGTAFPDWIVFNNETLKYEVITSDKLFLEQNLTIQMNYSVIDYDEEPPLLEKTELVVWYLGFSFFEVIPPEPTDYPPKLTSPPPY